MTPKQQPQTREGGELTGYELAGCADRAGLVVRVYDRRGDKLPLAADWEKFAIEVKQWLATTPIPVRAAGQQEQPREYKHFAACNGSRLFPAGEPGHSCSCFNGKHRSVEVEE